MECPEAAGALPPAQARVAGAWSRLMAGQLGDEEVWSRAEPRRRHHSPPRRGGAAGLRVALRGPRPGPLQVPRLAYNLVVRGGRKRCSSPGPRKSSEPDVQPLKASPSDSSPAAFLLSSYL